MLDLTKDWTSLPSRNELMRRRGARELDAPPPPEVQPPWDIPEKVAVMAAVSGRIVQEAGAATTQNLPMDFDGFVTAAVEVIEAGACGVHIDFGGIANIQQSGLSVSQCYDRIIGEICAATDKDWLRDVNILRGENFAENLYPIASGLGETAPMAPNFPVPWMEAAAQVVSDNGGSIAFSIHSTAEVDLANRLILSKGILKGPSNWIILIGYPYDDATDRLGTYLAHPKAMFFELMQIVDRIKEIDENGVIMVCAAGRAGHYLATAAMMLGLHVRIGTEDTVFRFPHKNELIESNLEMLERAKTTAAVLGRRLATPAEFREMLGIEKRPLPDNIAATKDGAS